MPTVEISLPFTKRLNRNNNSPSQIPLKLPKSVIPKPNVPDLSQFFPKPLKITSTRPQHKEGFKPAQYKLPTYKESKPTGQKRLTGEISKENWYTNIKVNTPFTDPSKIKIGSAEDFFANLPWNKNKGKTLDQYSPEKMASLYDADYNHLSMYLSAFGIDATKYTKEINEILTKWDDPKSRFERIKTIADVINSYPEDFQETTDQIYAPATSSVTINAPNNMNQYDSLITKYAQMYGVREDQMTEFRKIAYAIMWQESNGNPDAINRGTAEVPEHSVGLFQLNTSGGQGSGYSDAYLRDPENNIALGLKHIVPAFLNNVGKHSGAQLVHFVAMGSGHPGYDATNYDASKPYIEKYNQLTTGGGSIPDDSTAQTEYDSLNWMEKAVLGPIVKLKTTFVPTIKPLPSPFGLDTQIMSEVPFHFELPEGGITSEFGANDVDARQGAHTGTDYGMVPNTPVNVVTDGVVISVGENGGFGNEVLVEHKVGDQVFYTQYAHLRGFTVSPGEHVVEGQNIGFSGGVPGEPGAGTTTGPHLHVGVKVDGQWVDPVAFLQKAGGAMVTARSTAAQVQDFYISKDDNSLQLSTVKLLQSMGGYQLDPEVNDTYSVAGDVFSYLIKDLIPELPHGTPPPPPDYAPQGYYQDAAEGGTPTEDNSGKLNAPPPPTPTTYRKVINPRYLPSVLTEEQLWEMVRPDTVSLQPEQMDILRHTVHAGSDQLRYAAKIAMDELLRNWYDANPNPDNGFEDVLNVMKKDWSLAAAPVVAAGVAGMVGLEVAAGPGAEFATGVTNTAKALANEFYIRMTNGLPTGPNTSLQRESPIEKSLEAATNDEGNAYAKASEFFEQLRKEGSKIHPPSIRFDGSHGLGRPGEQFLNFEIPFTDKRPFSAGEDVWKGIIPDGIVIGIDEVGEQLFNPANIVPLGPVDNLLTGFMHGSGKAIGTVSGGLSTAAWKNMRESQTSRTLTKWAEQIFPERDIKTVTPDEMQVAMGERVTKWTDARAANPDITPEEVFVKEVTEQKFVTNKTKAKNFPQDETPFTPARKTTIKKTVPDDNEVAAMKLLLATSLNSRDLRQLANALGITRVAKAVSSVASKIPKTKAAKAVSTAGNALEKVKQIGEIESMHILNVLDHRTIGNMTRKDAIETIQDILNVDKTAETASKIGRWLDDAEKNNLFNDVFVKKPTAIVDNRNLVVDAWQNRLTGETLSVGKRRFRATPTSFENYIRAVSKDAANLWDARQSDFIKQHRAGMNHVAQFLFNSGEGMYKHVWTRALAPYFKLQARMVLTFPGYVIGNVVEDAAQAYIHGGWDAYGIFHNQINMIKDEFPDAYLGHPIMNHFREYTGERSIFRSREVYDPTRLGGVKDVKSQGVISQAVDIFSTGTGATALHNFNAKLSQRVRSNAMLHFIKTEKKKALDNFVQKAGPEMKAFVHMVERSLPPEVPVGIRTALSTEILSIMHKPNAEQLITRIYEKYTGRALAPKMIDKILAQHPDLVPPGARALIREWTRSNDITNTYAFDRFLEETVRPSIKQEMLEFETIMHDSVATHIKGMVSDWSKKPPNTAHELLLMEHQLAEAYRIVITYPDRLMSYPYRMHWASAKDRRNWFDMVTSVMEGTAVDPKNPYALTSSRWNTIVSSLEEATEKSANYWKNLNIDPTYMRARAARYREEADTVRNLWKQEAKEIRGLGKKKDDEFYQLHRRVRDKWQTEIANAKAAIDAKYANAEFQYRTALLEALNKDLARDGQTQFRRVGMAAEKLNPTSTPREIRNAFKSILGGTDDAYFMTYPERRLWEDTTNTLLHSDELGWADLGRKLQSQTDAFYKEVDPKIRAQIEKDINKSLEEAMALDPKKFSVHFEQKIDELHEPLRFKTNNNLPSWIPQDQWIEQQINGGHVLDDAFGSDPKLAEERWQMGGHGPDAWAGYYSSMQDVAWYLMNMDSKSVREGLLDGSISIRRVDKDKLAEALTPTNSQIPIDEFDSSGWVEEALQLKDTSLNLMTSGTITDTKLATMLGEVNNQFITILGAVDTIDAVRSRSTLTPQDIVDMEKALKDLDETKLLNSANAFFKEFERDDSLIDITYDAVRIADGMKKHIKAIRESTKTFIDVRKNSSKAQNVDQLINDALMYRKFVEDHSTTGTPIFRGEKWLKSELASDPVEAALPDIQSRWTDSQMRSAEIDSTKYVIAQNINNTDYLDKVAEGSFDDEDQIIKKISTLNKEMKFYKEQHAAVEDRMSDIFPIINSIDPWTLDSYTPETLKTDALTVYGGVQITDEQANHLIELRDTAKNYKNKFMELDDIISSLNGLMDMMAEQESATRSFAPIIKKLEAAGENPDLFHPDNLPNIVDQELLAEMGIKPNPRAQQIGSLKVGDKLEFSLASTTNDPVWADNFAAGLTSSAPRQPGEKVAVVYHFDENTPSYQIPTSTEREHMIAGGNFEVTHIEHRSGSLQPGISTMQNAAPDDVMHVYLTYKEPYLVTKSIDKPLHTAYPKLNAKQYRSILDKFKVRNPRSSQSLSASEQLVQYVTAALQNKSIYAYDNIAGLLTEPRLRDVDAQVNDVLQKLKAGAGQMAKHPISSPEYHEAIMNYAKKMGEEFRRVKSNDRGRADLQVWRDDVDTASAAAIKKYNEVYTNYDESRTLDYTMSHIFPFWTYESQRPTRLVHTLLQNPLLLRQFIYYAGGSWNGSYRLNDDYRVDPFGGMMFSSIERYANARHLPPSQYGGILGKLHELNNYSARMGAWSPGLSLGVDAWNAMPDFLGGNEDVNLMPSTLLGTSHARSLLGLSTAVGSVSGIDALKEVPTKMYDFFGDDYHNWLVMTKLAEKGYIYDQVLVAAENGQKVSNTYNTSSVDAKKLLADTKAEMIMMRTMLQNLPMPGTVKYSPVEKEDAQVNWTSFMEKALGVPREKQRELISKFGKKYFTNLLSPEQESQLRSASPEQWTQNFTLPFKSREDQEFALEVDKLYSELDNARKDFATEKTLLQGWLTAGHIVNQPEVFDPKSNSRLQSVFPNPDFQKEFTEKDYREALSTLNAIYGEVKRSIVLTYRQRGIPYSLEDWAAYNQQSNRQTPTLKHPYKVLMDAYYDIKSSDYHRADNPDETDWAAYQRQIDSFISLIPDEYKQQFLADINKAKTPTDLELEQASRALTEFNALPRYEGLTVEQGELLHNIFLVKKALDDKKEHGEKWTQEERDRYLYIQLNYGKTLSKLKQSTKRVNWLNTNPNAPLVYKWFLKDEPNEFVTDTVDKALQ